MQIKDILIKNLRGFEEEKIEFHPKLNVFIGSNASGKTTILEAILNCCYTFPRFFGIQTPHKLLTSRDINYVNDDILKLRTNISLGVVDVFLQVLVDKNDNIDFRLTTEAEQNVHDEYANPTTIPIFKFYPAVSKENGYTGNVSHNFPYSQMEVWDHIYHSSLSYSKFFGWFFENENLELRLKRDSNNIEEESPTLKPIRKAVQKAFLEMYNQDLIIKSDQIKNPSNQQLIPTLSLQHRLEKSKSSEFLDSKSDGEKKIVTLVADIAYNLTIAKNFTFDDDVLNSSGVVMIDEVETHLHPTWQRKILPLLTKVFPNIQFFVTTHSPQVISSVASESVFVCENFKVNKVNFKTKGVDSNTLLTHIFNSTERPQQYIDLINEFDNKIDEQADPSELEKIIERVKELQAEDDGRDIDHLTEELFIRLAAYKFDLEHEMD